MTTAPFTHQLRVRWGEVDAQGVVFNPNYLVYADVAGTEYFRHLGVYSSALPDLLQTYVVDAHIQFRSPARYDDILNCTVRPGRIGNSSFQIIVHIHRDDTLLTEIHLTYVRAIDGRSTPLSNAFRQALGQD